MEKSQFNTRAYNKIESLPFGLIKKSSSSDRLFDEVRYYDCIPPNVIHLFPRKTGYVISEGVHHLILEYYPYQTLGQYMICNDRFDWNSAFEHISGAIAALSEYTVDSNHVSQNAKSMYINKTVNEYKSLKDSYHDHELFSENTLVINGREYRNFETMWEQVEAVIVSRLLHYTQTMIHGDMCFSNILYHPKVGVRFIDMRGSFGSRGIYGDTMYDYAKLLHSVEGGYEFFINDKFSVSKIKTGVYDMCVYENKNKEDALLSYMKHFSHKDINLIRLVQGLIFIGMCARHYDSRERQMIMYLTGIKNLNEAMISL